MNILLIVPPFGSVEFQSLAVHNLQAVGREAGYNIDIYYANMHLASNMGNRYTEFCKMNYFLLGERMFARSAWGSEISELFNDDLYNYKSFYNRDINPVRFFPPDREIPVSELKECEEIVYNWVQTLDSQFSSMHYDIVGVTSSFEQINASVSILKKVKSLNPAVVTFTGGFNSEHNGAEGILSLDPETKFLDYIFSGESEVTFLEFLSDISRSGNYKDRIITGKPLQDMDSIPNLDYLEYFDQMKLWLPELYNRGGHSLVMETSRGCWWGEKSQCRFCGTSDRVGFREKSEQRLLDEIKAAEKWDIDYLHMADLIMPESYLNGFLQKLSVSDKKWKLYYEQKVNLNINEMELIKKAGITEIQPGLESLSSRILNKIAKGTSLKQNIRFLRDATITGFNLFWNIVWGIPGELVDDYARINNLIPLIVHLIPPIGIFHMTLVKFSPYFNNPVKYGIRNIKPIPSYKEIFPSYVDTDKIAIIHSCEYDSETLKDTSEVEKMINLVEKWKINWDSEFSKPRLHICRQGDGTIILLDTRGISGLEIKRKLSDNQIIMLIDNVHYTGSLLEDWALENFIAIKENGYFIPLPTIDRDIRREYENKSK